MELVSREFYEKSDREPITPENANHFKYAKAQLTAVVNKLLKDPEFRLIDDAFRKQVKFTTPDEYKDAYLDFLDNLPHEQFARDIHDFIVALVNVKRYIEVVPLEPTGL